MAKEAGDAKKVVKEKRPTAIKRDLQNEKARLRNRAFKSTVKTAIRSLEESIAKGEATVTKERLSDVYSLMDKGVKHGVYKANKASRTKARLAARSAPKA
jgi:small subunit ribosomal protein S20